MQQGWCQTKTPFCLSSLVPAGGSPPQVNLKYSLQQYLNPSSQCIQTGPCFQDLYSNLNICKDKTFVSKVLFIHASVWHVRRATSC